MRSERQYLTDMVEAAEAIARFLTGIDREMFLADELRQSAVIQKIEVIGEAGRKNWPRVAHPLSCSQVEPDCRDA